MVKKLPNIITVIRLVLIPVFIAFFYSDYEHRKIVYSVIFVASGISDVIDGFIARKFNCESKFGKLMDPFADKLMQISVAICVASKEISLMWVPIFLVAKEAFMIGCAAGLLKKVDVVVHSNWAGKLATVIYFFAFFAVLMFDHIISAAVIHIICAAFVCCSALALVIYIYKYLKIYHERKVNM